MSYPSADASQEKPPPLITIPNILSLTNLCFGLLAVIYAYINVLLSFLLILFAAIADCLDGLAARKLKVISDIGKEIDSLADIVSFGIAPAVMMVFIRMYDYLGIIVGMLYASCGALRLAKFNIYGKKDYFEGLPIPSAALFSSSAIIYLPSEYSLLVMLVSAPLMISTILYPNLKVKKGRKALILSSSISLLILVLLCLCYRFPSNYIETLALLVFSVTIPYVSVSPIVFRYFSVL